MMQISYPASRSGVEIARMPSGAVASMLEKEATKNTIFFDDLMEIPFVVFASYFKPSNAETQDSKRTNRRWRVCLRIVKTLQNSDSPRTSIPSILSSCFHDKTMTWVAGMLLSRSGSHMEQGRSVTCLLGFPVRLMKPSSATVSICSARQPSQPGSASANGGSRRDSGLARVCSKCPAGAHAYA